MTRSLPEITARIYSRIDRFVLDVGAELQYAFDHHRADYERWVVEELPFGLDKARRLRMIHKAYSHLPADVLQRLPRAWQAMFAISRLAPDQVIDAVESGSLHPELSVRATNGVVRSLQGHKPLQPGRSTADILVGRLIAEPTDALSREARSLLSAWLERRPCA